MPVVGNEATPCTSRISKVKFASTKAGSPGYERVERASLRSGEQVDGEIRAVPLLQVREEHELRHIVTSPDSRSGGRQEGGTPGRPGP